VYLSAKDMQAPFSVVFRWFFVVACLVLLSLVDAAFLANKNVYIYYLPRLVTATATDTVMFLLLSICKNITSVYDFSVLSDFKSIYNDIIVSRAQISTSVLKTTEVVALMPAAVTLWAASLVRVKQDTLEMDFTAQVN